MKPFFTTALAIVVSLAGARASAELPTRLTCRTDAIIIGSTILKTLHWSLETPSWDQYSHRNKILVMARYSTFFTPLSSVVYKIISYGPDANGDIVLTAYSTEDSTSRIEMVFQASADFNEGSMSEFAMTPWGPNPRHFRCVNYGD